MSTDDLEELSDSIDSFSIFHREDPESEVQDELVQLASEFRGRGYSYEIHYSRPDQPPFRLRSENPPSDQAPYETVQSLEPGYQLTFQVDKISSDTLQGICSELAIRLESPETNSVHNVEKELNLLLSRAFQAELYAEYQRTERYNSSFILVSLHAPENWRKAAKELKHLSKTVDTIGFVEPDQVLGIFLSRQPEEDFLSQVDQRFQNYYDQHEGQYSILQVPSEASSWNELQSHLFRNRTDKESDIVASDATEPETG